MVADAILNDVPGRWSTNFIHSARGPGLHAGREMRASPTGAELTLRMRYATAS